MSEISQAAREYRTAGEGDLLALRERVCPALTRSGVQVSQTVIDRADADNSYERVIVGHASVTDTPYQMRDLFGDYQEVVASGAFAATLAADPEVAHRIQHQGLGISSTRSGTLTLTEDSTGLRFQSVVDVRETDAADLVSKLSRGVVTHTSFAFRVTDFEWSPDFSQVTIKAVDLDGGDVASCCYGANPAGTHTVAKRTDDDTPDDDTPDDDLPDGDDTRQRWAAKWRRRVTVSAYDLDNSNRSNT